ncbi:hypothetical protein DACRYDRAFT_21171 [Dacryopinax primogenitus]|uniref:Uncharacterized protein n=1 Tax=Dacryopinax primogenitus (strain DJM 731) TaxID=1858805 RepID=M5G074_DACPD|nr:uncharacterized protein DACRYDRAFT_21171 [Dacryopinax primogenitus]EJU03656.1 hypothetical protein DACRYDRAFT_21171 [Dacryopinax primogenitus]
MSLAHELAAALAPEPGANAKALAEELGLEFDEEEGAIVDPSADQEDSNIEDKLPIAEVPITPPRSIKSTLRTPAVVVNDMLDPVDAFTRDAKLMDRFMLSLKTAEPTQSEDVAYEPSVEDWISDLLRRLRTTFRDRDMQVKQFEQIARDLRHKIDTQVDIPEITLVDGWLDGGMESLQLDGYNDGQLWSPNRTLEHIPESPDETRYNDQDDGFFTSARHSRTTSNAAPVDPVGTALTALSAIHTNNNDLIASLSSLSDQAQVNGATNADAARQLRLIRNRLTGMRDEWESVERSRLRIQRWENGDLTDDDLDDPALSLSNSPSIRSASGPGTPRTPPNRPSARQLADQAMEGYTASMKKASQAAEALRSAVGISVS